MFVTIGVSSWCGVVQAYNPINYLRNVAINNSRTAYTFYVDVDLVPGPSVYDSLCRRVAELHRNNRRNVVIIDNYLLYCVDTGRGVSRSNKLGWTIRGVFWGGEFPLRSGVG